MLYNAICMYLVRFMSLEEHSCLWKDCGFCSVESAEEFKRHVYFHCYHTKLKQWGQGVLKGQPSIGTCTIGLHNRNIVPDITDNFICQWEQCEVRHCWCGLYLA